LWLAISLVNCLTKDLVGDVWRFSLKDGTISIFRNFQTLSFGIGQPFIPQKTPVKFILNNQTELNLSAKSEKKDAVTIFQDELDIFF